MDDSGFPRTPDRPVKLLGTCVCYLRSVETSIGARGPDFLGGSATCVKHVVARSNPSQTKESLLVNHCIHMELIVEVCLSSCVGSGFELSRVGVHKAIAISL